MAAVCRRIFVRHPENIIDDIFLNIDTDFAFQATRRNWTISMSKSGIDVFGYEFTDPDATVPAPIPIAPGSLGGACFFEDCV